MAKGEIFYPCKANSLPRVHRMNHAICGFYCRKGSRLVHSVGRMQEPIAGILSDLVIFMRKTVQIEQKLNELHRVAIGIATLHKLIVVL